MRLVRCDRCDVEQSLDGGIPAFEKPIRRFVLSSYDVTTDNSQTLFTKDLCGRCQTHVTEEVNRKLPLEVR